MSAMAGLILGESSIRFEDTVTGEKTCVSYLTDTNLDGVFDEKDLEVNHDLTSAVLTSENTFSSANAMASVLSDAGIVMLGKRSGGGSCALQYNSTADGWFYSISGSIHLINAAGEDIDSGVPVKEGLMKEGEEKDYSVYYDFDRIRSCLK